MLPFRRVLMKMRLSNLGVQHFFASPCTCCFGPSSVPPRGRCVRAPHLPATLHEGTFLNGWCKQGNDLPTPLGRADLVVQIFFPWSENSFKAGFSRGGIYDVFRLVIAAGETGNLKPWPSKSRSLNYFQTPGIKSGFRSPGTFLGGFSSKAPETGLRHRRRTPPTPACPPPPPEGCGAQQGPTRPVEPPARGAKMPGRKHTPFFETRQKNRWFC
jgi:hypothetical protein